MKKKLQKLIDSQIVAIAYAQSKVPEADYIEDISEGVLQLINGLQILVAIAKDLPAIEAKDSETSDD